jgi:AcrR family transcriptional regulator
MRMLLPVTSTGTAAGHRRGRPRAGTSAAHREVILDAAFELLVERGYQGATMAAVAERTGSSKETLYAWFGNKQGLLAALIHRQAEATNQAVAAALDNRAAHEDPAATLTAFATNLLRVLLGEPPPDPTALAVQARVAVQRFLTLTAHTHDGGRPPSGLPEDLHVTPRPGDRGHRDAGPTHPL